jgi:precorrin-6A/cobalt-precorrin-6A reductase
VLILGGTTEAADLARRLDAAGWPVTTSLAGRTSRPAPLPGAVRVGGFGGVVGLAAHLRSEPVDAVVDATHPFAAQMPHHAAAACAQVGVPRLRLVRPGWTAVAGDRWVRVPDLAAAAEALVDARSRRVFLTTGRQELAPFARLEDVWFLVRSIDRPDTMPLARATVVLDRGPFVVEAEQALMAQHAVDTLVTKDSGGASIAQELAAARALGLPVVVVDRPPSPDGTEVTTVAEAMAWLASVAATPRSSVAQPGYRRGV